MPPKHSEELVKGCWTIEKKQDDILNEEALARAYNSTSELVRDIFAAWIEENHNSKP